MGYITVIIYSMLLGLDAARIRIRARDMILAASMDRYK